MKNDSLAITKAFFNLNDQINSHILFKREHWFKIETKIHDPKQRITVLKAECQICSERWFVIGLVHRKFKIIK